MGKFKVGDQVFNPENLFLFGNPYHYKSLSRLIETVSAANERLFTASNNEIPSCIAGMDEYAYFRQETGNCLSWASPKSKRLHMEVEREQILELIKEACAVRTTEVDEYENNQIERMANEIEGLKLRIIKLKAHASRDREVIEETKKLVNSQIHVFDVVAKAEGTKE